MIFDSPEGSVRSSLIFFFFFAKEKKNPQEHGERAKNKYWPQKRNVNHATVCLYLFIFFFMLAAGRAKPIGRASGHD